MARCKARHVSHVDKIALDDLYPADLFLFNIGSVHLGYESFVYLDNYAVYPRQKLLNKTGVPFFESFLHNGVVRIVEYLLSRIESLFKSPALVVNELTDKLRNGYYRVSIVELYRDIVCKFVHAPAGSLVLLYDIGDRCTAKEILLFQAELLALVGVIVRIKHTGDIFCEYLFL